MSKKTQVIEAIFEHCQKAGNFEFDNDLVKDVSKKIGFGNPFDATKIDNRKKLPSLLRKNDYAILHKGNGKHLFVKGIDKLYHDFEPITETIEWEYKKSILNQFNSSESNILSVANNQRILHHFLFGKDTEFDDIDIIKRPKTYFPHRTKTSLSYHIGKEIHLQLTNIQIEIDLTIEFNGHVGVFEGKNGTPDSFNVYQIYHPFLYYYKANNQQLNGKIDKISAVYVVRTKENNTDILKLWEYTFANPLDITSIEYVKAKAYKLKKK